MSGSGEQKPSSAWYAVSRARDVVSVVFALALTAGAIRVAGFGVFDDILQRVGAVAVGAIVVVLTVPVFADRPTLRWAGLLLDAIVLVSVLVSVYWFFLISEEVWSGLYFFDTTDIVIGCCGLAAVLELARRSIGLPLFIVCLIAIGYALFGEYLPTAIRHAGFPINQTLEVVWYSFDGVFGRPVAVVTSLILIFVVFGAVLEAIGTGQALLNIAQRVSAGTRGGPAHGAIVASALFGTMSGSTVANVVGTGVFTMPMIRNHGFPRRFAGAIEAAASTGGQIMPPVMGAVAFIMADVTGLPYTKIAVAALVPALFFYASLFAYVSVKAGKSGLKRLGKESLVKLTAVDARLAIGFVVPIAVIIGALVSGRTPAIGGFWATATALFLGLIISPQFRRDPKRLLAAAVRAGKASAVLILAVAAVGVVVGVLNMTGLGLKFASAVLSVSGENLIAALVLTMAACLILGMGMPTVPAYLIIVMVMGPALAKMGIPLVAAHLFAVYYGVLSVITPPVALAAFAASPICGAPPLLVAAESVKVAAVGFVIPFVFVFEPSLLLINSFDLVDFLWAVTRLSLAIWIMATALEGWAQGHLSAAERAVRALAGIGLLFPIATISLPCLFVGLVLMRREGVYLSRRLLSK